MYKEVFDGFDAVVCGGGVSGFIAASAAARLGARTAVIEENGFFGGCATAGLVAPISEFKKNGRRIIGGLPWEFVKRLAEGGGADVSFPSGNVPFDPELYKLFAQRMVTESGAVPFMRCRIVGCEAEGRSVSGVVCSAYGGDILIKGKYFVDGTGGAELCRMAGAEFHPAKGELQPASLCFRMAGVDLSKLDRNAFREQNTKYADRVAAELLRGADGIVPNFGGPWFLPGPREGLLTVNMTRAPASPDDPLLSSETELRLREDAHALAALLSERVPGFERSYIVETAVCATPRETRRIVGLHTLTAEEFLSGERFPDTIALAAHPVDIHHATDGGQDVVFPEREGAIPFRSLVPVGTDNLIVPGRCLSADRGAFAAIRVQAPAMATGQAAGAAAALCAVLGVPPSLLDADALRRRLESDGAILA